jgi:two-component system sensor histidine kinase CpxA
MRNLYLRIFLSFWVAMALVLSFTVSATLWLADQHMQRAQTRQDLLAREASAVLASGGLPGLHDWLDREIALVAPDRLYVLDQHGNDLLERPVPPFLQEQAGHGPRLRGAYTSVNGLRLLSQLVSPNNQMYSLSLSLPRWRWPFGIFGTADTALIGLIATLLVSAIVCLLLARYLSDPVRHLRAATRSIAAGDLTVRVAALVGRRRDELALLAFDFDAMAERLRTLLESQRQLLRDVSHELRSPLARLQIALGLARRPQANLQQELDRIDREAQRLDELIGEILSLSRLDDPERTLSAEPVNMSELLETLADNARLEAEPRWVRVDLVAPVALTLDGDRELLFRALENVVRNAVSFSPQGALVQLSLRQREQEALIEITDQGPGVPSELLDRIFEPFFRVGKAREHDSGGHGIGLAITARVVALHRGTVRARNVPAGGLQVEITLPLHQPSDQKPPLRHESTTRSQARGAEAGGADGAAVGAGGRTGTPAGARAPAHARS